MHRENAFTLLETIMVILIIGIIAVITIPKFLDLRIEATNAKFEGCRGAMRSAVAMYYARTSLPEYDYLCTTTNLSPPPNNTFRTVATTSPCYPASCDEFNDPVIGIVIPMECNVDCSCYDSTTGNVVPCG